MEISLKFSSNEIPQTEEEEIILNPNFSESEELPEQREIVEEEETPAETPSKRYENSQKTMYLTNQSSVIAPQVRIINGNIVIDEASLVVQAVRN